MDGEQHAWLRRFIAGFRWQGVDALPYKAEGSAPFKTISRQLLFADDELNCQLRYFEIDAGGYSTLERHRHMHAVMVLRGRGRCLVGQVVGELNPHDLITVPAWTWHQFRAARSQPLGFLCMVNADRDRPQQPSEQGLREIAADPVIAAFLDGRTDD